ncbi:ADP-ribosylglycohydrolase family protein [candidate division KSB1 bacterium]|nr:ADP-ribosylglycohydrolase family protein [candidate division KSB1 bacterium]
MRKIIFISFVSLLLVTCTQAPQSVRRIKVSDYVDKMQAGWVGQMVGVGWGGPTEFKWTGQIIPEEAMPEWQPHMVNQFGQDDIYVEMTFLRTLEQYGFDVDIRQAGIDFANSKYMLWHANRAGRDNLRAGIAPPFSGHPQFNSHADDIDYQIEADYAGLISPGMPQSAIDLGEIFGRLMNYGDGLYGGQFVAGMYAEAFFENDIETIILAGLACIPAQSQYHEAITDVLNWYQENPDNWQITWELIEAKYQDNPEYRKFSCSGANSDFNIDAKINGAYIVMGLLYGKGDPDQTVIISTRCGQDSDCNPSNAAGVLFTTIGFANLDEKFTSAINPEPKFSYTDYNFPGLIDVCESLARQAVQRAGGAVELDENNNEWFMIPVQSPKPSQFEQCWDAAPVTRDVNFTEEEMQQITVRVRKPEEFVRSWQIAGPYQQAGLQGNALFDVEFPPENKDAQVKWQSLPPGEDGYVQPIVPLDRIYDTTHAAAYMKTQFRSDSTRPATLEIGSDDGVKVWLNDELVHALNIQRGVNPGEDKVDVTLKEGWNDLLLKVTQGEGGWGAVLCIVDEKNKAITDLEFKN